MIKLKEIMKVVSFPVWINSEEYGIYCEDADSYLKQTNAGMRRSDVKYVTTDGNGELTIEI